jgi:hypothetical protein
MDKFVSLALLISVISCASSRTKYKSFEDKEGFRDKEGKAGLKVTSFKANARTKKNIAELFAKFRAIENCMESGFKLTHILDVRDKTVSKDVIRSSSTGFPSYYYGMSPFYSRYHTGFGLGFSTMSSNTWEETYSYPEYEVTYECANTIYEPELILREVPAEEMKLLVKDLKGGLQVEEIIKGSPNKNVVQEGDVILRANDRRLESKSVLIQMFEPEQTSIPVEIMREGIRKRVNLKSVDVSNHILESQNEIIKNACRKEEVKKRDICKSL